MSYVDKPDRRERMNLTMRDFVNVEECCALVQVIPQFFNN